MMNQETIPIIYNKFIIYNKPKDINLYIMLSLVKFWHLNPKITTVIVYHIMPYTYTKKISNLLFTGNVNKTKDKNTFYGKNILLKAFCGIVYLTVNE